MRASLWVASVVGFSSIAAVTIACKSTPAGTGGTTATTTTTVGSSVSSSTKATSVTGSTGAPATGTGTTAMATGSSGTGAAAVNCNPVTATPCDVAGGETCDSDGMGGYVCYPPPNDAKLCGACDPSATNGPFCAAGLTCVPVDAAGTMQQCVHFCCTDADCGGTAGSCDTTVLPPVGICGKGMMGGTTAATSTGAGTSTGTGATGSSSSSTGGGNFYAVPVCNGVPMTPPSNGSCYTIPAGG